MNIGRLVIVGDCFLGLSEYEYNVITSSTAGDGSRASSVAALRPSSARAPGAEPQTFPFVVSLDLSKGQVLGELGQATGSFSKIQTSATMDNRINRNVSIYQPIPRICKIL